MKFSKEMLASVGEDVVIADVVEIPRPQFVTIGSHVAIDSFFSCTAKASLGDYIHIANSVSIIGGVKSDLTMGHFSFISTGARIICGSEDYTAGGLMGATIPAKYRAPIKFSPVVFEPMSGVGANAVVMPGVTMAVGSMAGAGAIVTKSTEPWGIYVGAPAKLLKHRTEEDIKYTYECFKQMGYFKLEYDSELGFYFDNTKEKIYTDVQFSKVAKDELKSMYALDLQAELIKAIDVELKAWIAKNNRTDIFYSRFELCLLFGDIAWVK